MAGRDCHHLAGGVDFVSVSTVALAIASLVVKDFYVPYRNPTPEREFRMTRWLSLLIGFLPLIFVLFVPEVLKLSFFTRAIRLSISVVAIIAFYLPFYSTRGANAGLIGACVMTSLWYLLGDPFGINNMYVALVTPAVIMLIDRLIPSRQPQRKMHLIHQCKTVEPDMTDSTITVERNGKLHPHAQDAQQLTAMLPSVCPQNHAANLLPLPNGDLLCVWFGGTQEGIADISVWCSRLAQGSAQWSDPQQLSDDPARSEQNPVLFLDPEGVLWLLWTAQKSGNQDTAIVRYRQSHDLGHSWSAIDTLLDQPGTFIRQPLVVLPNGNWLLPVFYCRTQPGVKWVGNDDISAVKSPVTKARAGAMWRCRTASAACT